MELQFQRREHNNNEIASVLLKSGDTIDDSVAMFDAVSLSGGLKKALVSISVGMHWNSTSLSLIRTPNFPSHSYFFPLFYLFLFLLSSLSFCMMFFSK